MPGLYSAEWRKFERCFDLRYFFSWATLQMGGAHACPLTNRQPRLYKVSLAPSCQDIHVKQAHLTPAPPQPTAAVLESSPLSCLEPRQPVLTFPAHTPQWVGFCFSLAGRWLVCCITRLPTWTGTPRANQSLSLAPYERQRPFSLFAHFKTYNTQIFDSQEVKPTPHSSNEMLAESHG